MSERKKHCGRGTHICISNLTIIGSDNGLSPDRRHAIIWIIARILLIGPLRINFSEILFKMWTFSFKKMRLKISSAKWCLFRLSLDVLKHISSLIYGVIIPFSAAGSLYFRPYPAAQLSWHVQNFVTVIFFTIWIRCLHWIWNVTEKSLVNEIPVSPNVSKCKTCINIVSWIHV